MKAEHQAEMQQCKLPFREILEWRINEKIFFAVLREKKTELNNARNKFETELKNRAEESKQLMEEWSLSLEERMRAKFDQQLGETKREHARLVESYEAREQAWQLERQVSPKRKTNEGQKKESFYCNFQDLLSDTQRLKADCDRYFSILRKEVEDESLSPTKRQSLTREVESLQVYSRRRRA